MARRYGLYLDDKGITDRATVIVSRDGVVRFAESVTPGGERDIDALAAACEAIDAEHGGGDGGSASTGLPAGATLYVKTGCPFCRFVQIALANLHAADALAMRNISEDEAARAELERIAGKTQVPCLVLDGRPMHESADIARFLAERFAPLG